MKLLSRYPRGLLRININPVVFFTSAGIILLFVIIGAVFERSMQQVFQSIQDSIVSQLGWFYIFAVALFLILVVGLLFTPYAGIRLGKDGESPRYSYVTWLSMLFSAGMGIGLLFFSVAEPLLHFSNPPRGEGGTLESAEQAMRLTFFHWGLHAWAIYIVVGLALAYFAYRHDLPLTIRSSLYPILGNRIYGPVGDAVDIFAVIGTMFGVATSLGLGVMQVNAGLDSLGLLSTGRTNQLLLIGGITIAATVSVVSGLDRGIRRLSEMNLGLGLALLLFVLIVGPTAFILSFFVQSIGEYLSGLVALTFRTDALQGIGWQKNWTMFYWGWWISWSPFVGMFIARVSRGRTIREFIIGVLFVPTILTFIWLVVFGSTALNVELFGAGGMAETVTESLPKALYGMLETLPLSVITVTLATVVVITFFVTSSDSGSLVIDILTSDGDPHPPVSQRVFWALTEGGVAAVLLLTGGLLALQTAAIVTALPFCIIMLVICYGVFKGLRAEKTRAVGPERAAELREGRDRIQTFIDDTVMPAFQQLKAEVEQEGRSVVIDTEPGSASITVFRDGVEEFNYAVHSRPYHRITMAFPHIGEEEEARTGIDSNTPNLRAWVDEPSGSKRARSLRNFDTEGILREFREQYRKWARWAEPSMASRGMADDSD